ncbi:MAG: exosortase-associated EpsI family protein [Verrucomicrobiaceae bacterium]|nr:exosortase-associated EpsI family protein [Verrucomicrobiaceae bacterium]
MFPLVLSAAVVLLCFGSPPPSSCEVAGVVMKLPTQIGILTGIPQEPTEAEADLLPTDTTFAKMTYYTTNARPEERDVAHVSIVLAGAESRSIHRPEVCLPGQGWSVTGTKEITIPLQNGRQLRAKDLTITGLFSDKAGKRVQRKAHYVYWFTGTSASTPSHTERIVKSAWDAVIHNVTHRWAYSSVMAQVTDGLEVNDSSERKRTDEETLRLITYIIREAAPQFVKELMPR